MELLFFIVVVAIVGLLARLPRVGGEGERDLIEHNLMPIGPLHHA